MKGHLGKNNTTTILSYINGTYTIYIHTVLFIKINSNKVLLLSFSITDHDNPRHPFYTVWKRSFSQFFFLKYSLFSVLSHSSNNTVAFSSSDFPGTERCRLKPDCRFLWGKNWGLVQKRDWIHLTRTSGFLIFKHDVLWSHLSSCPHHLTNRKPTANMADWLW